MVLRAVDDPTDELHIVAALRSPLLGCGDDDLFRFKVERRGHWNYLADQPDTVPDDDPVRAGLAYLREPARRAALAGPVGAARPHRPRPPRASSSASPRAARATCGGGCGSSSTRPARGARRPAAACASTCTGSSCRSAEGARVAESVLPETDDDAVRIMTIHAAKGLEFPITIVSGMSTAPQAPAGAGRGRVPAERRRRLPVRQARSAPRSTTSWKPIDEQMGFHERIRLLYVACTRARDHLVVSLHRKAAARSPPRPARGRTPSCSSTAWARCSTTLPDAVDDDRGHATRRAAGRRRPLPCRSHEWAAERDTALAAAVAPVGGRGDRADRRGHARRRRGDLDAGLQKRPRDLDLPPWLKGRYGTAVGRAVHGVLQTIDLATGDGLDAAVGRAVRGRGDPRSTRPRSASSSSTRSGRRRSVRPPRCPHWREVYACTPVAGGRLLEGYIDLLYRGADGLVVVDYKTAARRIPAPSAERVDGYRLQGATYALAIGRATGEPVVRVTFLFLTPDGPVERDLDDLATVTAEVETQVIERNETVVV